jgi:hypothetical protein
MNRNCTNHLTWLALSVVSVSLLAACDTARPTESDATANGGTLQSPVAAMGSSGKPIRSPLPNGPISFPAGQACSFPLLGTVVVNKEVSKTFPPEANGDVLVKISGRLVFDLTNGNTNKTIEENLSGPGTEVFHTDGSVTFTGLGRSLFVFTPTDIPAGPMTFIYSGQTVETITPSGQSILLSQSGNAEDVCAALS